MKVETTAESCTDDEISTADLPLIVSLFAGAGGLDLGFFRAGFELRFATDLSESAMKTHARNFPATHTLVADLLDLGAEGLVDEISRAVPVGATIGIIGGPPCQGFSYGNPTSSVDDPRNQLARVYVEVVEALSARYDVAFTVFENVPGLKSPRHRSTYDEIVDGLTTTGLRVEELVLRAVDYGVPQTRTRVILIGLGKSCPGDIDSVGSTNVNPVSDVFSAIGHLAEPAFFARGASPSNFPEHPNHWTMRPMSSRFSDPDLPRTKSRSFRRLNWANPSPTIAFGHREIHVHPDGRRRLSIFEAMLLQGFPQEFVLEGTLSQQVEQVSNAVPPPLAESVAYRIKQALASGPQ